MQKNRDESHLVKRYKICDFTSWAENLLKSLIQRMDTLKSMINTVGITVPVFIEVSFGSIYDNLMDMQVIKQETVHVI